MTKFIKVYGYIGCQVVSAEFVCRDEADFGRQVEAWAKRLGVVEWSRANW